MTARARDADRVAAAASALPEVRDAVEQSADDQVAERLVVRQAVEELPDPGRTRATSDAA